MIAEEGKTDGPSTRVIFCLYELLLLKSQIYFDFLLYSLQMVRRFPLCTATQHADAINHGKALLKSLNDVLTAQADRSLAYRALKHISKPLRQAGFKVPNKRKGGS